MKENKAVEFGNDILDYVNTLCHDNVTVANTIAKSHRTLQQNSFDLVVEILRALSKNDYDARNEYAVKKAKEMIALID